MYFEGASLSPSEYLRNESGGELLLLLATLPCLHGASLVTAELVWLPCSSHPTDSPGHILCSGNFAPQSNSVSATQSPDVLETES